MIYGWYVCVNENTHGLENAFCLVGIYVRVSRKHFWRGQRHMRRGDWTSGADGAMKSGLQTLPCPILCFEGEYSIEEHLDVLMVEIGQ